MNNNNNRLTFIIILVIIVAVILMAILIPQTANKVEVLSYSEVITRLRAADDDPERIVGMYFTGNYQVNILYLRDVENLKDFKNGKYKSATSIVTYRDTLLRTIDEYIADDNYNAPYIKLNNPDSANVLDYIFPIIMVLLLIGIAVFMFISIRGGKSGNSAMSFGRTKARVASSVKVRFNDVAGAEEEKEELKEIVEFLKSPKKFRSVGARIPKGALLVGQPGTGKTLFAKAVAGEANVPFFSISGSDFVEMFVGVGASRVRDLFNQAKKSQPCIVFIDEIDAVGRKRGAGLGGGNDEREQTLNQLLVQMDGFDETDGVVIMAATNRVDVLDPALLRPGRFDRQIYVNMPDVLGREGIFRVHSRNKPLAPDIDFKNLARMTTGFSGADIENILNEAAILAARDGRLVILMKDILEGINKVIAGPQKRSRVITEKDKRITAYHEAGHAIVGKLLKHCDEVQEISIIPRGLAAGYVLSRPKSDDNHVTKNQLNDMIAKALGGRAAEEIIINDITTGASQDLKQATSIARSMVAEWGMSDALPNVFFGGEQEVFIGRDYQTQASYSEEIAAVIDKEIRKIVDDNYERALNIIKENQSVLHNVVRLLYEFETIYGDELEKLLLGATVEEVTSYIYEKKKVQENLAEEKRKAQNPLGNVESIIVSEPSDALSNSNMQEEPTPLPLESEQKQDQETSTDDTENE